MLQLKDKKSCCGCTACYNICPKSVIEMKEDDEGFLYPVVNEEKCVKCGMCVRICPILQKKTTQKEETEAYIVRCRDENIVEESTSGGAFSVFAISLLGQGAVVYGTGYDEQMQVVCKKAEGVEALKEMRGSKFVQSRLDDSFKKIKEALKNGTKVLFTGTPCQVAGLIYYLGEHPDNLICIDFVCRGVPSPMLWKNYVHMMEKRYHSKMVGARFKHKTYGYHSTTMKVDFVNGKTYYGSGRVDPYMKAFIKELASRPSCSACAFKSIERLSDITIFDCYKFSEITSVADDNKGYTSLLIHTPKGKNLLNALGEDFITYKTDIQTLVKKNGIMVLNSAKPNAKREEFYIAVSKMEIDEAMQRVCPITMIDKLIESTKGVLYRTGLIRLVQRLKKEKIEVS